MTNTIYVQVSELPDSIKSALKAVRYGRNDIGVETRETYMPACGSSSGRRAFVMAVNLATGEREQHLGSWGGPNMFSPSNAVDNDTSSRPLAPGFAVIHGSQGDKVYASLTLHPSNVAALLPAKSDLTDRQRDLLNCYAGLTSAGRKDHWERRGGKKPTEAELVELVNLGMVTRNKAGAVSITTKGRNNRSGGML